MGIPSISRWRMEGILIAISGFVDLQAYIYDNLRIRSFAQKGRICMDYIKEFQEDRGIRESVIAFSPQLPQRIDGREVQTGALIQDNGDILFCYYAPGAESVEVETGRDRPVIALQDRGDGVWEGTLPYDPLFAGPHAVQFRLNGIAVLDPYTPIWFAMNRPVNYIEVPDPETADFIALKKHVPHGTVTREIFWSDTIGDFLRCFVYLPAGYEKGGEYPVLYLQHGATENETSWLYNGKAAYILDNLLYERKCVPFLVVMNDGMVKGPTDKTIDSFDAIEQIITTDCRKYIEAHYRTKTDKWNRAIAGLSLGSMQASYIGMRHPELYGSIGVICGFMRRRDTYNTYELSTHLDAVRNSEKFMQDYRLFFRCEGDKERQLHEFLEDDAFCAQYGVDKMPGYHRILYPNQTHEWGVWRRALRDFAQLLFRAE